MTVKFPPSPEIKRAIWAVQKAGVQIKSIEIQPRKIIVLPEAPTIESTLSPFDEWERYDERSRLLPPRIRCSSNKINDLAANISGFYKKADFGVKKSPSNQPQLCRIND